MGLDDNADTGVATGADLDDGVSTGQEPDGGRQESATNPYAEEDAQLERGPWHRDARWQKVYGGYKELRTLKPEYERIRGEHGTFKQEIDSLRDGSHPGLVEYRGRVEQATVQERDKYWIKAAKEAGPEVFNALKSYFERKQKGDNAEPVRGEDAPWRKDLDATREELAALRAEREAEQGARMRAELDTALTAGIKQHAPSWVGNEKAATLIATRATELAKSELKPAPTKANPNARTMAKPFGEYVKVAIEELQAIHGSTAQRAKAPTPGIKGGAPTAGDRAGARQARIDALFDQIASDD